VNSPAFNGKNPPKLSEGTTGTQKEMFPKNLKVREKKGGKSGLPNVNSNLEPRKANPNLMG